ncbi:MAG: hypothetical protein P1U64_10365 [Alcanivoracaceae bacterium]|nr:hypothetical protein [Alcanivoracaceae bacterium]
MKKILLAFSVVCLLAGCGGDDDDDLFVAPDRKVSGQATAPSGTVALLEPVDLFEVALGVFIPSATAAITGLDPVEGATVELIRVDDNGDQVGEVLASTTTSISGNYTLTLPAGVNLAGNLVVRIEGGGTEMRAQVVERSVDINPVSEYVLQSFVESGASLETLTTSSVVKLTGQVEEFDLTAGADLADMIAKLENETGAFVDAAIETITSEAGDVSAVAGDYKLHVFQYGLFDSDNAEVATFGTDVWTTDLSLADGGSGDVDVTVNAEDSAYSNFTASTGPSFSLSYFAETSLDSDSFSGLYSSDGVVSVESPFEEIIDGDFGFRFPPSVSQFQKALNDDIFFAPSDDAAVRYAVVEGAVDPNQREGDEIFRGLEVLVKQSSAANASVLSGDYGRVYLGAFRAASGQLEFEVESGKLNFSGVGGANGGLDVLAQNYQRVEQTGAGTVSYFSETTAEDLDIDYDVNPDGSLSIDGSPVDGMTSPDGTLVIFNEASAVDDGNLGDEFYSTVDTGYTLAVKLPSQAPILQGSTYRVMSATAGFDGNAVLIRDIRFSSEVTFTGNSGEADGASFTGSDSEVYLTSRTGNVSVTAESFGPVLADYTVAADGEISIVITDGTGTRTMTGYMSDDGSIGVLTDVWAATASDPTEVGLAMLVKLPAPAP